MTLVEYYEKTRTQYHRFEVMVQCYLEHKAEYTKNVVGEYQPKMTEFVVSLLLTGACMTEAVVTGIKLGLTDSLFIAAVILLVLSLVGYIWAVRRMIERVRKYNTGIQEACKKFAEEFPHEQALINAHYKKR